MHITLGKVNFLSEQPIAGSRKQFNLSPRMMALLASVVVLVVVAFAYVAFNFLTHRWEIVGPDGPYGIHKFIITQDTRLEELIPDQAGPYTVAQKLLSGGTYARSDSEELVDLQIRQFDFPIDAQKRLAQLVLTAENTNSPNTIIVYTSPTYMKLIAAEDTGVQLWWVTNSFLFSVTAPDETSLALFMNNLPYRRSSG
jgi:hypothetical protein